MAGQICIPILSPETLVAEESGNMPQQPCESKDRRRTDFSPFYAALIGAWMLIHRIALSFCVEQAVWKRSGGRLGRLRHYVCTLANIPVVGPSYSLCFVTGEVE